MSDMPCVRCGKHPVLHEFICAECIYDDYTREADENEQLRSALQQLDWYRTRRKNWSPEELLEMIFRQVEEALKPE